MTSIGQALFYNYKEFCYSLPLAVELWNYYLIPQFIDRTFTECFITVLHGVCGLQLLPEQPQGIRKDGGLSVTPTSSCRN